jgi:hypothetical protein
MRRLAVAIVLLAGCGSATDFGASQGDAGPALVCVLAEPNACPTIAAVVYLCPGVPRAGCTATSDWDETKICCAPAATERDH